MSRLVLRWTGLAASVVVVVAALVSQSGTCADSADAAASFCSSGGSGGLLLIGLSALTVSVWMLTRAYRASRHGNPTR